MTVAVNTDGDQLAVLNTEHTLATITAAGVYVLAVDLAVLAPIDEVVLRIYGKARSTGTERLLMRATYGPITPYNPLVESIPITSPHHFRATLQQIAGSVRTWPWAVYEL